MLSQRALTRVSTPPTVFAVSHCLMDKIVEATSHDFYCCHADPDAL